jgi:excisionase family DNA binding protein
MSDTLRGPLPHDTISPEEAAEVLGVSVMTIRRAVNDGRLRAYRVLSRIRIPRDALAEVVRIHEGRR